jgi:hypothetical protein
MDILKKILDFFLGKNDTRSKNVIGQDNSTDTSTNVNVENGDYTGKDKVNGDKNTYNTNVVQQTDNYNILKKMDVDLYAIDLYCSNLDNMLIVFRSDSINNHTLHRGAYMDMVFNLNENKRDSNNIIFSKYPNFKDEYKKIVDIHDNFINLIKDYVEGNLYNTLLRNKNIYNELRNDLSEARNSILENWKIYKDEQNKKSLENIKTIRKDTKFPSMM